MKRKMITWLLLLSTCTLYACGKGGNQSGSPAESAETGQAPASTAADNGVYENFTWDDEDFLLYGLEGLEKFKQQEPVK